MSSKGVRIVPHWESCKRGIQNKSEKHVLMTILFFIEQQAKIKLTDIPRIDTGFLRASGYLMGLGTATFSRTWSDGQYKGKSPATGKNKDKKLRKRERAQNPQQPKGKNAIVLGFAAAYAFWIEQETPFLMPSILRAKEKYGDNARIEVREPTLL